ncbi:MAG: hypothetical protein DMF82_25595 [Acidobacteria bacterium]|nr:MAG: hypothetical protein DMF82_25595 [Acidobacteriota bacterium]
MPAAIGGRSRSPSPTSPPSSGAPSSRGRNEPHARSPRRHVRQRGDRVAVPQRDRQHQPLSLPGDGPGAGRGADAAVARHLLPPRARVPVSRGELGDGRRSHRPLLPQRRRPLPDESPLRRRSVHDRPGRPFCYRRAPSAPQVYLTQRLLARELDDPTALDPSAVIETALALAASAVASAFPAAKAPRPSAATRRERQARERVEAVRSEIARAYDRHQPLEELAATVGFSVYHLCRTFRKHTGLPVHRYRNRLRLRAALERLADPGVDLTGVALDVGFSSHSHFTAAFRAEFGVTPSQVRRSRFKAIRSRLFWPPASKRNVSVM